MRMKKKKNKSNHKPSYYIFRYIFLVLVCGLGCALSVFLFLEDKVSYKRDSVKDIIITSEADFLAYISQSGKKDTVKLKNNITLETSHEAIGNLSRPFNGVFDGGGYTITLESEAANLGLFGYIGSEGVVKNLGIKINHTEVSTSTYAPLAYQNNGKIENIKVDADNITFKNIGVYSSLVVFNEGTIMNVVVNSTITNGVTDAKKPLVYGNIATYNRGVISDAIAIVNYLNFNETNKEKIFKNEISNRTIGAIIGSNQAGTIKDVYVIASNNLYLADLNRQEIIFTEDANTVFNDDTFFLVLNFSEKLWKKVGNIYALIEGNNI